VPLSDGANGDSNAAMHSAVPFARRFTNDDLRALGIGRATLRRWLETGAVRRVAHGVYESSTRVPDPLLDKIQVRLAVERGAVLVPTLAAASRYGLWTPRRIPTQLLSADGRRVVPSEFTHAVDGRAVQTLEWTAVQLARWQPMHGALVSLDSALRLGASRAALTDVAVRMRGWPGSRLLRRAIDHADARSESALESWSRGLLIVHGLPMPELQFEVVLDGMRSRCDFAYPQQRVILEADGEEKLGGTLEERKRADYLWHRRQGRLQKAGYIVVRWGWKEVDPDHAAWAQGIRSVLSRR